MTADNPIDQLAGALDEYARRVKEPAEQKAPAEKPPTAKERHRLVQRVRARTLSADDDPTAADMVQAYFEQQWSYERLTFGLQNLIFKHGNDTAYVQRCFDAWDKREAENEEKLKQIFGAWVPPEKQLKNPN